MQIKVRELFMDGIEDSEAVSPSVGLVNLEEEKSNSSHQIANHRESKGKRALQARRAVEDLMEVRRYQQMHEDFYPC